MMKFKDYIRQMDDEELAAFLFHAEDLVVCGFCGDSDDGVFCNAPHTDREQYCITAMQNFLEKDIEDQVFDDLFCR